MPVDPDALYAQAQAAASAKDRARARQLLLALVRANPLHEAGWLLLSTLAEDPAQSIDCLQRVLAINPGNARARQWLALAQRAQARPAEASAAPAGEPADEDDGDFEPLEPADQPVPRLGRYLLDFKFVSPDQLAAALAAQAQAAQSGRPRLLGEILLERGALPAERMEFALREQRRARSRLSEAEGSLPTARSQPG
ncbi:MAG: hypothetical protein IT318_13405 [Anaerolineales bacterium]|nr:hypothetical protein [Anaerolineales bacterium]